MNKTNNKVKEKKVEKKKAQKIVKVISPEDLAAGKKLRKFFLIAAAVVAVVGVIFSIISYFVF